MSQDNVEIAQAVFAAWNRQDMDAFRELLAPDVVMRSPEDWPEPGPFVGVDAVMRQLQQNRDVWDADRFEPAGEFIDVGDRVAVRYRWHGTSHEIEQSLEATILMTMRRGKIIDCGFFWDHAEALEAVGLEQ